MILEVPPSYYIYYSLFRALRDIFCVVRFFLFSRRGRVVAAAFPIHWAVLLVAGKARRGRSMQGILSIYFSFFRFYVCVHCIVFYTI